LSLQLAKRHHLGSESRPNETIWFTLVFEDASRLMVERYNDTRNAFIKDRLIKISPKEFGKHFVNGASLQKLVQEKLKELSDKMLQG
jgi:hypothetical protein